MAPFVRLIGTVCVLSFGFCFIGCSQEKTVEITKPEPSDAANTETTKADSEETETRSNKVLLGSSELTAGIPGEGALTVEQIQKWLDEPENHTILEVELPMGLSAGAIRANIWEGNPFTRAKIELGRQLYFDARLSADGSISCASCHAPDEGYARHTRFGVGIRGQEGNRNSPVSYNRIFSEAQFWDGRAASLEEQAIGPIANPIEMGNTHEAAVKTVAAIDGYRIQFEKVFGEDSVTIENIGKAIAAFERVIVTGPTPYDYHEQMQRFLKLSQEELDELKTEDPEYYAEYERAKEAAEKHPMSESAVRGKALFFSEKASCTACHAGANFSDEQYHNIGIGMDQDEPDLGRYAVTKQDKDRGAFKTPTIRNIVATAPYMHDGSVQTLEEVVAFYAKGGHPNDHLSEKIKKLELSDQDKKDLVEFMKACTGEFPVVETGRLPE